MNKEAQLSLFCPGAGEVLREEAIDRVEQGASSEFLEEAEKAVRIIASRGLVFSTDDVWEELSFREIPFPREPRAMGAVMRALRSDKVIKPLDSWVLSRRPACHRRPIRLWVIEK